MLCKKPHTFSVVIDSMYIKCIDLISSQIAKLCEKLHFFFLFQFLYFKFYFPCVTIQARTFDTTCIEVDSEHIYLSLDFKVIASNILLLTKFLI